MIIVKPEHPRYKDLLSEFPHVLAQDRFDGATTPLLFARLSVDGERVAFCRERVPTSSQVGIWPLSDLIGMNPKYDPLLRVIEEFKKRQKESSPMPGVSRGPISPSNATPWDLTEFALSSRSPRILLYGPPGTGKTMTAFLWARHHGFQCLSTTLTEDTPMTELRGHFVLKGQDFVWHDGLIARAWRMSFTTPVLVILNEIDHASGDTSTFLHNALDDPEMARLDLPNDETIMPKAGSVLYVATMNGTPEDLSDALRDRFPVKVHLPSPNPAAIAALPEDLRTFGANLQNRTDLTLRGLYEFARLRSEGANVGLAAKLIFGDADVDLINALKLAE